MARTPNYDQERRERDRIKAAKKAEKLAAKTAEKQRLSTDDSKTEATE